MKILIADPSHTYRELVKNIIEEAEIEIETLVAKQGAEAVRLLEAGCPDIICVSHELGDIDSFSFINILNEKNLCKHTPKFLLTSNNSLAFRRQCYDSGYTEILHKSDVNSLKIALHGMLHTASRLAANILYVEDVASTAAYTSSLMKEAGWKVKYVATAEEALQLAKENNYDLLVTDLILAGKMSGLNLIDALRAGDERLRKLPILALSGWNDVLRQVYVLQSGASDFIAKPFHEHDFLARALNLIQTKKQQDKSLKTQKMLYHEAHTDQLTELCNRRCIDEYAQKIVEDALSTNEPLSLLVIDIDHFKHINDSYGHDQGDKVLHLLGKQIKSYCRQYDLAGRIGGEEFIILLPKCDIDTAFKRAEYFRANIESLNPAGIPITGSIGLSELDKSKAPTFDSMFKLADKALYKAKNSGRNKVMIASN